MPFQNLGLEVPIAFLICDRDEDIQTTKLNSLGCFCFSRNHIGNDVLLVISHIETYLPEFL
jgi:hypothetical protein